MNITLGEVQGHQALLVLAPGVGEIIGNWVEGEEFQLSAQGLTIPCFFLGGGQVGERVYFQRSGSKVTGFTVPGLFYGIYFKKM